MGHLSYPPPYQVINNISTLTSHLKYSHPVKSLTIYPSWRVTYAILILAKRLRYRHLSGSSTTFLPWYALQSIGAVLSASSHQSSFGSGRLAVGSAVVQFGVPATGPGSRPPHPTTSLSLPSRSPSPPHHTYGGDRERERERERDREWRDRSWEREGARRGRGRQLPPTPSKPSTLQIKQPGFFLHKVTASPSRSCCGQLGWNTKMGPVRSVKYHILTECKLAFRPKNESSGDSFPTIGQPIPTQRLAME
ncbi:Voltage-dependent calcium channel type A subunit alpha-1 [Eumeta japonica]|uniref:Voltage-dependent calcium channel type A subunit alpha-1 n=1 Tax=Eumeta variegata TaxID=151549 RepID=A0A4C1Z9G3_EUMVA|nr:Voltage-dependent calcium channel type A subunit alpha-1 [Eumeta japonica]